jgi:3-deoxy-manno-octulosonate cytidylyltransferase (CMP-KDO synthetase)
MRRSSETAAVTDALGVIPARYASTRLPGKPLASLAGKPLVQHVWEKARAAKRLSAVVVATEDERIARVVRGFGGEVMMTSATHATGTDRVAEVARDRPEAIVLNIQGDEPLADPADIDTLVEGLADDATAMMATLATPLHDRTAADNPNVVKVVCDAAGRALYFSRALIPWPRNLEPLEESASTPRAVWRQHIGLYAFRRPFLLEFASWPSSPLERMEGLEQLRALERGHAIRVLPARGRYHGVDTPEDLVRVAGALGAPA